MVTSSWEQGSPMAGASSQPQCQPPLGDLFGSVPQQGTLSCLLFSLFLSFWGPLIHILTWLSVYLAELPFLYPKSFNQPKLSAFVLLLLRLFIEHQFLCIFLPLWFFFSHNFYPLEIYYGISKKKTALMEIKLWVYKTHI